MNVDEGWQIKGDLLERNIQSGDTMTLDCCWFEDNGTLIVDHERAMGPVVTIAIPFYLFAMLLRQRGYALVPCPKEEPIGGTLP